MSLPFWLAMAGWAFTYLNSRALAKQAEANAIGANVDKMLQEISDENYKFWRDANSADQEHTMKCQLFQSFITFRCNFIELRIKALRKKCRNRIMWDGNFDAFETKAITLIAELRDLATLDSEQTNEVSQLQRRRKIMLVNKKTIDLHEIMSDFILSRFRSVFSFEENKEEEAPV